MKVTLKLVRRFTAQTTYLKEVEHKGIAFVEYQNDWIILVPLDSEVNRISYRKELVFAVIEEKEECDED
ncbi:MAG: hypothetical protein WBB67_09725 [bacterium]